MLVGDVVLEFEVLPNKPLAAEWKNNAETRYRADKMINALAKEDANKRHIIIALTHKEHFQYLTKGSPTGAFWVLA